jgi:hypothetical protein
MGAHYYTEISSKESEFVKDLFDEGEGIILASHLAHFYQ